MNRHNTIQRAFVLDAVMSMSNHPTADEVYDKVVQRCPTISKGTVYRNLNLLADEGCILRVGVANAPDRYDKTANLHCHFRCSDCGRVYDYTLAHDIELSDALNPGFSAKDYEFIINGVCRNCNEKQINISERKSD